MSMLKSRLTLILHRSCAKTCHPSLTSRDSKRRKEGLYDSQVSKVICHCHLSWPQAIKGPLEGQLMHKTVYTQ